jgi:hypothetical protein
LGRVCWKEKAGLFVLDLLQSAARRCCDDHPTRSHRLGDGATKRLASGAGLNDYVEGRVNARHIRLEWNETASVTELQPGNRLRELGLGHLTSRRRVHRAANHVKANA